MKLETRDKTIAPITAGQKPATSKPGVKYPANEREIPFTTNKNNPKVRIVRGKVRIVKIGLTIAFTNPKTIAATAAAGILSTLNPGTINAVIESDIVAINQVKKKLPITLCFNLI